MHIITLEMTLAIVELPQLLLLVLKLHENKCHVGGCCCCFSSSCVE